MAVDGVVEVVADYLVAVVVDEEVEFPFLPLHPMRL